MTWLGLCCVILALLVLDTRTDALKRMRDGNRKSFSDTDFHTEKDKKDEIHFCLHEREDIFKFGKGWW